MLTNEKVLKAFRDYLARDPEFEVVRTSHGYTVLWWDTVGGGWLDARCCKTPEDLLDALLFSYGNYLEDRMTHSDRDLTETEKKEILDKKDAMRRKCEAE